MKFDGKDGFLFIGNQLALDFLNTRPIQNGECIELLPDFNALARWFQAAGLLSGRETATLQECWRDSPRGRQIVRALREFRERLRKQVLAWEHGIAIQRPMIEELNQLMAEHPMRTRLKATAKPPLSERWFEAKQPEDLFAPLAESAATLFTEINPNRVRKCGNCVLHFYDTSKKGTRRWCSMQLCGNRLKVAAYAARQRTR